MQCDSHQQLDHVLELPKPCNHQLTVYSTSMQALKKQHNYLRLTDLELCEAAKETMKSTNTVGDDKKKNK